MKYDPNNPSDLAHANEDNLFAALQMMGHFDGGELHDEGDCVWFISGVPVALFNGIMQPRFAADSLDARLAQLMARFRERQLPMIFWVTPSARPADLRAYLPPYGLRNTGGSRAMSMPLYQLNEDVPYSHTLTVERVTHKTLDDWGRIVQAGYNIPEFVAKPMEKLMLNLGLDNERGYRHYLVRDAGHPIAVSTLYVKDGIAGIYTVATLPDARGKGAGTLVTLSALRDARAEGCTLGILQSTQMGYPIYRKLGFTEDFKVEHWVWTPQEG